MWSWSCKLPCPPVDPVRKAYGPASSARRRRRRTAAIPVSANETRRTIASSSSVGAAAQRHAALAMLVRPGDGARVDADRPFARRRRARDRWRAGAGCCRPRAAAAPRRFRPGSRLARAIRVIPSAAMSGRGVKSLPSRDGGVGAVHRRLVQPAPDPPVRRARPEERPHRCFHARHLDGVDEPLRAAMQPARSRRRDPVAACRPRRRGGRGSRRAGRARSARPSGHRARRGATVA